MDQITPHKSLPSGGHRESTYPSRVCGLFPGTVIMEAFSRALYTAANEEKCPLWRYLDFLFHLHPLP